MGISFLCQTWGVPVNYPNFYRPQRSWAKVIFSQACVCPQGGVCLSACWDIPPGTSPPEEQTPPDQSHPTGTDPPPQTRPPREQALPWDQTPPGADPSREQTPPRTRPPWEQTPPPPPGNSSIRSTSGRYASYWNAFLWIL